MYAVCSQQDAMEQGQHRQNAKKTHLIPTPPRSRLIRKTALGRVRSGWKENGKEHAEKSFRIKETARRVIASTVLGTVDPISWRVCT